MSMTVTGLSAGRQAAASLAVRAPPSPGVLRRAELNGLEKVIKDSDMTDEMTQTIDLWRHQFMEDLTRLDPNDVAGVKEVCDEYIELAQEFLFDPITKTPIRSPRLGSDGNVYEEKAIAIWKWLAPVSYRDRSPLDVKNPAPLTLRYHPVAEYLVKWLSDRGALLCSEDLEKEYDELASMFMPEESEEEMLARILAKDDEMRQYEETLVREGEKKLMEDAASAFARAAEGLKETFSRSSEETRGKCAELAGEMASRRESYKAIEKDIASVEKAVSSSYSAFEDAIKSHTKEAFNPLVGRAKAFQSAAEATLQEISEDDRKAGAFVEQKVQELQRLAVQKKALQEGIEATTQQIGHCKVQQKQLDQGIERLHQAIEEKKEEMERQIFTALAIVGSCLISTVAVSHLAPGVFGNSSMFSIKPLSGGASLNIGIVF